MKNPSARKNSLLAILVSVILILGAYAIIQSQSGRLAQALDRDKNAPAGLKEALYWQRVGTKVQCGLCPRKCVLADGQRGFCRARKNVGGTLYTISYGYPVAIHIDPIEKKPFAHVYPGTRSFSIATAGCNLRCKFCQNWEISQADPQEITVKFVPPQEIVRMAKETKCRTIAFTYTEPTIFYEYMLEIAQLAKKEGIACVMHSAGTINEAPLRELAKYLTAANIDLKGFSEKYYSDFCEGSLKDVLNSLKVLKEEGVWIEITNLLVPTANDSPEDITALCRWIKENLGQDTPVHFSRFFPMYKLLDLSPTPVETLIRARDIALKEGLRYVYIGNVPRQLGEDTICPACGKLLIKRTGYTVLENNLTNGRCKFCNSTVAGIWD